MWLLLTVLYSLLLGLAAEEIAVEEGIPCSKYQVAFNRSCYEFVRLPRAFTNAQSWCERGGGHLVFIENEETQEFLQKHISEDREWWIGLTMDSTLNETSEGSMMWLDTSNVSYSHWHQDQPSLFSAACGHILKNAGYEWGVTENCSQEFDFVCEFESGQSIACDNSNATVQCGSGEVIQIDDSFYGRKTPHYCVLETPLQFDTDDDCSWTSVKDEVAGSGVTYTVLADNMTLTESTAKTGIIPHNLTLDSTSQQLLGLGIHLLAILASSNTTISEVSESLTVHLVEPISGLQASLASHTLEMGKDLEINVSVAHGVPDKLKFEVVGSSETYSHQEDYLKGEPGIYTVPIHSEGTFLVKVLAMNAFSNMSMDIGSITVSANNSLKEGACWPGWNDCVEQQVIPTNHSQVKIPPACLPPPNSAVTVKVTVSNHSKEERQDEQCLYVTAKQELHLDIRCETNCKPVNASEEVVLSVTSQKGPEAMRYNWYLDNTFHAKPAPLPAACTLNGFRQSSLMLLLSNRSALILNSSFLQTHGEVFQIKVIALTQHEYGEETHIVSMVAAPAVPACAISPEEGSVLTSFTISCSTSCLKDSCLPAQPSLLTYCFYLKSNSLLHCGPDPELSSIYLPLGEEENDFILHVTVTVSNSFGDTVHTNATVKVRHEELDNGNQTLHAIVSEKTNTILKDGNNSMSLFQLYKSVSSVLNQETQQETYNASLRTDTRKELRELMLTTLSTVNVTSMQTALKMSEVLKEITHRSEELSSSAQVEASNTLKDVSESLLRVNMEDSEDDQKRKEAASYLFNAVSNVLEASVHNRTGATSPPEAEKSLVSHKLLNTVENLQSAFLFGKLPDDDPVVLATPSVAMYINRLQTDSMDGTSIRVSSYTSASFTLPSASSLSVSGDDDDTLDLRASDQLFL
ncbi:hypothetical protein Y1Q_0010314 [Alligator mississippiensis]|uniref:Polycystic kidney disease protein 1-like 2 n=1 Tax=Alligator mississippiensis TaxID=8496 RepID=A0A151NM20_ALLMI|nr:hypothetical protein Y1Q_0010314 [Alligator mississippiensis]